VLLSIPQHISGNAPQHQTPDEPPPARSHDNERDVIVFRSFQDRCRNIATGNNVNGDCYGKSKTFQEIFFLPDLDLCVPDVRFVRLPAFGAMGSIDNMLENDLLDPGNSG
jgi:hypothetical protein